MSRSKRCSEAQPQAARGPACTSGPTLPFCCASLDRLLGGSGYDEPEPFSLANQILGPKVVPLEL